MRDEIDALIFDVFGTVVDWRTGVANGVRAFGLDTDAEAFADAWRARYQPKMEEVRSGGRPYTPLDVLHLENLRFVLDQFGLSVPEERVGALNDVWHGLPPWPDCVPGLTRLKRDFIIAPCSNGSIAMMTRIARFGGLPWDAIVGAEIARDYKPRPEVYRASARALGCAPGRVMMVAAHNNDLEAARNCGLRTAFFPRPTEHGPGQTTDLEASEDWDIVARDIEDLADQLGV
jgi:2-haloacid dehalogenase